MTRYSSKYGYIHYSLVQKRPFFKLSNMPRMSWQFYRICGFFVVEMKSICLGIKRMWCSYSTKTWRKIWSLSSEKCPHFYRNNLLKIRYIQADSQSMSNFTLNLICGERSLFWIIKMVKESIFHIAGAFLSWYVLFDIKISFK